MEYDDLGPTCASEDKTYTFPYQHQIDTTLVIGGHKRSNWSCEVLPQVVWTPQSDDHVPNWFHRWMQRLVFGFKWKYNSE